MYVSFSKKNESSITLFPVENSMNDSKQFLGLSGILIARTTVGRPKLLRLQRDETQVPCTNQPSKALLLLPVSFCMITPRAKIIILSRFATSYQCSQGQLVYNEIFRNSNEYIQTEREATSEAFFPV
jgi:hypothetical protein